MNEDVKVLRRSVYFSDTYVIEYLVACNVWGVTRVWKHFRNFLSLPFSILIQTWMLLKSNSVLIYRNPSKSSSFLGCCCILSYIAQPKLLISSSGITLHWWLLTTSSGIYSSAPWCLDITTHSQVDFWVSFQDALGVRTCQTPMLLTNRILTLWIQVFRCLASYTTSSLSHHYSHI